MQKGNIVISNGRYGTWIHGQGMVAAGQLIYEVIDARYDVAVPMFTCKALSHKSNQFTMFDETMIRLATPVEIAEYLVRKNASHSKL